MSLVASYPSISLSLESLGTANRSSLTSTREWLRWKEERKCGEQTAGANWRKRWGKRDGGCIFRIRKVLFRPLSPRLAIPSPRAPPQNNSTTRQRFVRQSPRSQLPFYSQRNSLATSPRGRLNSHSIALNRSCLGVCLMNKWRKERMHDQFPLPFHSHLASFVSNTRSFLQTSSLKSYLKLLNNVIGTPPSP